MRPGDGGDGEISLRQRLRRGDVAPGDQLAVDEQEGLDREGPLPHLQRAVLAEETLLGIAVHAHDRPEFLLAREGTRIRATGSILSDLLEEGVDRRGPVEGFDVEVAEAQGGGALGVSCPPRPHPRPLSTAWRGGARVRKMSAIGRFFPLSTQWRGGQGVRLRRVGRPSHPDPQIPRFRLRQIQVIPPAVATLHLTDRRPLPGRRPRSPPCRRRGGPNRSPGRRTPGIPGSRR